MCGFRPFVCGTNKSQRKISACGTCASRGDLLAELADVIITAAITMSGITGVQWTKPAVIWNGA
jgi:hypothetical protein